MAIPLTAADESALVINAPAFLMRDQFRPAIPASDRTVRAPYKARFWQPGDEAYRNMVQTIVQTPDGFLWVGTQAGLARFDGEQFEFVPIGSSGNLTNENATTLCATTDGCLWVGTEQSGLFQLKDGQWKQYPLPSGLDTNVISLLETRDGTLWVGTRSGMGLYKNEKLSLAGGDLLTADAANDWTRQAICSMTEGREGEVWVGTADNLVLLKNSQIETNLPFWDHHHDIVRSVCRTRDGTVWAGENSGLVRFKDGQFTLFSKTNGLPDNTIKAVFEDRRGNLWVGTYGGLCRLANGQFVVETTAEGEPYDKIFCFFEDREGNLWVGAKNGLYQLGVLQFTSYTTRHGLAHNNVVSVNEDSEGAMWIGTWGGGLHCLRDGRMTIHSKVKNPVMRNDLVLGIHAASDGGVWFGEDYDGGLYRLLDGRMQRFGSEQRLRNSAIRALCQTDSGQLLIGTAFEGLKILEDGKVLHFNPANSTYTNGIRVLLPSRGGRVWIGTEFGLGIWTNGSWAMVTGKEIPAAPIYALHEDAEENLWIGMNRGLGRWQKDNFTFYDSRNGLLDDAVLEILEDDFENLWLATRQGICRVRRNDFDEKAAGRVPKIARTLFGKNDGMASQVCVSVAKPSALKTKDGCLWFATTKGLAVTDPKLTIENNVVPPPVVIRVVVSDKKRIQGTGGESEKVEKRESGSSHFPTFSLSNLLLPPGRGELEFHYTALSYTAPEKNQFRYKLEGLDSDWIEAGSRRVAFYNSVPPGAYTFRVIASNNDGLWNGTGAMIRLTLQPHFWQTWSFQSFVVMAALSGVAFSARFVTRRRMQRKLERLEQQNALEKERARIARDMHDGLGSRLTEILLVTDQIHQCRTNPDRVGAHALRVANVAREVVDNLDALVWTVNPSNDTLAKLVIYIREYANNFIEPTSIRLRFDTPTNVPEVPLSSDVRHNLLLVLKEALNNAVRYAECSEILISLRVEPALLRLSVEDNGKGFSPGTVSETGNGLQNMKKRVVSAGGCFELSSEPGKGTKIWLEIPLQHCDAIR